MMGEVGARGRGVGAGNRGCLNTWCKSCSGLESLICTE